MDKITNDARVYTDVQGLEKLRAQYKSNPEAVKKEVSQQFESLLFQMVLRSMRDANSAFNSDLFSSNDMSFYQDMFDKQLSLSLSSQGLGFAKMIEDNIDQQNGVNPHISNHNINPLNMTKETHNLPVTTPSRQTELGKNAYQQKANEIKAADKSKFQTPKDFIHSLWASAKQAAKIIGVHPSVILAQAALETDWGKKIISHANGSSTHNLFNIKSDPTWRKEAITTATLEQKDGVLIKEKASFRSYDNFNDSFQDYAEMVKNNPRYHKAIANADNPLAYTMALQDAGYATDSKYSNKIMGILNSPSFKAILTELKII